MSLALCAVEACLPAQLQEGLVGWEEGTEEGGQEEEKKGGGGGLGEEGEGEQGQSHPCCSATPNTFPSVCFIPSSACM